jgi:hypothetical protein
MTKLVEFHEHPDGWIIIRTLKGDYIETRENFKQDFGPIPSMPAGADDHVYTPGRRHCYMGDGNIIDDGPMPWDYGDRAIAAFKDLITKKKARDEEIIRAAMKAAEEARAQKT